MINSRTTELLIRRGAATAAMVTAAQAEARSRGERVCSRLLAMGVDEGKLAAVLSERHGLPGVDLSRTVIPLDVLDGVPQEVAQGDLILPLSLEGRRLHLAVGTPDLGRITDELRFITGLEISPYLALRAPLQQAIQAAYAARHRGEASWAGAAATAEQPHVERAVPRLARRAVRTPSGATPAAPAEELVFAAIEAPPVPAPPPAAPGRPEGQRLVLVVDDEPTVLLLASRALEKKGFAIATAADGKDALEKAQALRPDLVLLDAMLPRLHGFEVCLRLRADPSTSRIPVVIMTAVYRGWRYAQDAREAYGAEDYVEKPFHVEDLQRRVAAVLERRQARQRTSPQADASFRRGRDLYYAGRGAEAVAAFEEALAADPWSGEVHLAMGLALRATGELFRAMTHLERAAELRPERLQVHRALAALYRDKGFRRKAVEALERALGVARDDERAALRADIDALLDEERSPA